MTDSTPPLNPPARAPGHLLDDIAHSAWLTLLVLVCALTYVGSLGILSYWLSQTLTRALAEGTLEVMGVTGVAVLAWEEVSVIIITFLLSELLLNAFEVIGRRRSAQSGWTLPIIWVPLGRTARLLCTEVICALVLLPKMLVYLLYVLLAPLLDLLLKPITNVSAGAWMDFGDQLWEGVEWALRLLFNAFYYTKVEAGADVLTIWFNHFLLLWLMHQQD